jgi:hypothetical protein
VEELRVIRSGLRTALRRAGFDLVRWPVTRTGYTLDAVLQRVLAERGITHLVDVGARDGAYGRSVRDLGFTGTLVSFEPDPSRFAALAEVARADGHWDVHPVALGASPGTLRIGGERVPVARLDDRLDTVVPRSAVVMLRLCTGVDLEVLKGAEKVSARIGAVQTRGPANDGRPAWLEARGFQLAGLFPVKGEWEWLGTKA